MRLSVAISTYQCNIFTIIIGEANGDDGTDARQQAAAKQTRAGVFVLKK